MENQIKFVRSLENIINLNITAEKLSASSVETGKIYSGLVSKEDPDFYTVANAEFIPMLVKAVQELSTKNDALEARIATLESA